MVRKAASPSPKKTTTTPNKNSYYEALFPVGVTLEPPMSPAGSAVRSAVAGCLAGRKTRRADDEDVLVAKRHARALPSKKLALVALALVLMVMAATVLLYRPAVVYIPVGELGPFGRAIRSKWGFRELVWPSTRASLRGSVVSLPRR
jgi:hypothetical protein